jgi:hypothetical protein
LPVSSLSDLATDGPDTNLLQEYWRDQAKRDVVQELLDFAKTGSAELVVIARIAIRTQRTRARGASNRRSHVEMLNW